MSNLRICMLRSVRPNVSPISQAHDASEIPDAAEDAEIDAREGKLVNSDVDHAAVKKAIDPVPLPDVPIPSPEEVRRHNITHLPYKRWCKWCVCARRNNSPHFRLPPFGRRKPLMVLRLLLSLEIR